MFKYSKQQQLRSLGQRCELCQRGPRRTPDVKAFMAYLQPRKRTWWIQLWLLSSAKTCLFETKNCHVHHCLTNSRNFQDLACRFPWLSRTKVIFQLKFQDFPGGVGTLIRLRQQRPVAMIHYDNDPAPFSTVVWLLVVFHLLNQRVVWPTHCGKQKVTDLLILKTI